MTQADTPMPGEDPASLDEIDPATEEDIETNPQPQPTSVPEADDPAVADTEVQPT